MKTILYICTKNQYDWNFLLPQANASPTEMEILVLLLQDGIGLTSVPNSHVSILEGEGKPKESSPYDAISYQDFLEKIFQVDLPLVL